MIVQECRNLLVPAENPAGKRAVSYCANPASCGSLQQADDRHPISARSDRPEQERVPPFRQAFLSDHRPWNFERTHPMIRTLIVSFMLAGSIAALASPEAKAQSPDPALLAPPAAQAGLAPPIWSPQPYPRYAVPAPRPGGNIEQVHIATTSRRSGLASQSHARR
jgi:hypothetical protein